MSTAAPGSRTPKGLVGASDGSRPAWSFAGASRPDEGHLVPIAATDLETRFEGRGELGAGGMGRVRMVRDHWLGRLIAIKEPATDADARRLWREALVTARLEHPGIVPIYDLGQGLDGTPWFAMRIVRGRSLAELLRPQTGRVAPSSATSLFRALLAACEAVGFAHHEGVVHRDLKPANLMIGAFGEIQVIDWGLAQAADLLAADSGSVGTAAYMSPEQARAEPVDARADVWSLGAILFEVVTGRPVRVGDARTLLELARAGTIPPLPDDLAPDLRAIIAKALSPRAADRYENAKALADDLGHYLEGRRVQAHTYRPRELLARFVRAWRIPLIILATSLIVVIAMLVVGIQQISAERTLAEGNLASSLAREAQVAFSDHRVLDVEQLAGHALENTQSPRLRAETRGLLAAIGTSRPARVDERELSCWPVALDSGGALCLDASHTLSVHRDAAAPRVLAHDVDAATLLEGGALVAATEGRELSLFDAATGQLLWRREDHVWSRFGSRLSASQDPSGALHWNNFRSSRVTRAGIVSLPEKLCGEPGILTMASRDSRRVVAACADGSVSVVHDGAVDRFEANLGTSQRPPLVTAIALIDDDTLVVGAADGSVERLHLLPAIERAPVTRERSVIRRFLLDPHSRALVFSDGASPLLVDLDARAPILRLPERDLGLGFFDADGHLGLAVTSPEHARWAVARWTLDEVRPRQLPFRDGVTTLATSLDGRWRAIGDGSNLRLLDRADHVVATARWQDSIIKTLAFDGGNRIIAHGQGSRDVRAFEIREADTTSLTPVDRYHAPAFIWRRLAVLFDGSIVATAHRDEQYLLQPGGAWRLISSARVEDLVSSRDRRSLAMLVTGGEIRCGFDFAATHALTACARSQLATALALDDRELVALDSDGLTAWPREGSSLGEPRLLRAAGAQLVSVALGQDFIAAGARDGAVWIWSRDDEDVYATVRIHAGRVDTLAFDAAGRVLYAGGWDGQLSIIEPHALEDRGALGHARITTSAIGSLLLSPELTPRPAN